MRIAAELEEISKWIIHCFECALGTTLYNPRVAGHSMSTSAGDAQVIRRRLLADAFPFADHQNLIGL